MAIHIVQCLCPERHCIISFAYVPGITAAQADFGSCSDITLTEANAANYLRSMVEGLVARNLQQPRIHLRRPSDAVRERWKKRGPRLSGSKKNR